MKQSLSINYKFLQNSVLDELLGQMISVENFNLLVRHEIYDDFNDLTKVKITFVDHKRQNKR